MQVCTTCVLPETYPGITFDDRGVCNFCRAFERQSNSDPHLHFNNEDEVKGCLEKYRQLNRKYDVLVPLSGGVDSCFTLIQIVEKFELRPLVFHSDHGWDDPQASQNVENLCRELDVDLLIWKNDLKFMKKLFKYFNESKEPAISACFACGNMLYLNGLELADSFNIPLVVNGYSKGQAAMMYDREKAQEWYGKMVDIILETGDTAFLDKFVRKWEMLKKQVIYQGKEDLMGEVDPGKILFIPLFVFKFYKTQKEKLVKICRDCFGWQPIPCSYPARTTNCRMIWLNSYRDLHIRRYTHYHDEYSTLIRAGEIPRDQVLADLKLEPPEGLLEQLADEVNIDLKTIKELTPVEVQSSQNRVEDNAKPRILLAMLPFWSPLIPPLGIACLKSFLQGHGYYVRAVDVNILEEFRDFSDRYYRVLNKYVPAQWWGNYFVTGKDVLQNHMMAYIYQVDEGEYRQLVKDLVLKTFFTEVDETVVEELHHLVHTFYGALERFFIDLLGRERPDVLGFSVFEGTLPASLFVARLAKRKYPRIKTVMGGGIFAEQLAPASPNWQIFGERVDCIDKYLVGEGEHLFLRYLQSELPEAETICSWDQHGQKVLDLAAADLPDLSDFDLNQYPLLPTYASRSCPFQCKFCSETLQWGPYRKKSASRIADELQEMYDRYGRQLVLMCDSLLNPVATDLARELIDRDVAMYWDGYLRVDRHAMDPETTLLWRRGGYYKAKLGIESGSPRVLKLMNKQITVDQVRAAVSSLASAGIKTSACWVIGYPGETEADFQQTLDLIEELKDDIYEVWASPFYYFPGGQVGTSEWQAGSHLLYPPEAGKMLLVQTWIPGGQPSREQTYGWMNRFVDHCDRLGVPNPFTLHELYKADERWKKLHENAVPSIIEFEHREVYIDDRKGVKKLIQAPRSLSLEGDFGF